MDIERVECPHCNGSCKNPELEQTGKLADVICSVCRGRGTVPLGLDAYYRSAGIALPPPSHFTM